MGAVLRNSASPRPSAFSPVLRSSEPERISGRNMCDFYAGDQWAGPLDLVSHHGEDMTEGKKLDLEQSALRVREHIIRMATGGGCFIGASLSCADLLTYLYRCVLKISPAF
jgi:hypothetical protein